MKTLLILAAGAMAFAADTSSDAFYTAIRNNDLQQLKGLLNTADALKNRDARGITPLMSAAAAGSMEAMRMLIEKGADVNATNAFGSTALMWSVSDLAKTRLLLDSGANVNAASKAGRTALLIAAMGGRSSEIVELLIARGADVKAKDGANFTTLNAATIGNDTETIRILIAAGVDVNTPGGPGFTPLINAASVGNVAAAKMLIAKGANVNAVSAPSLSNVKNGPIALGNFTPLIAAATVGSAELVKALLSAGASVNAKDVRGMTPLMLAIATDRQNPEVIRMLLAGGADLEPKSLAGETAADWARKFPGGPALRILGATPTPAGSAVVVAAGNPSMDAPAAVQKSLALLEKTNGQFFLSGGCTSCHHQNITEVLASIARARGIRVDEKATADRQKLNRAFFDAAGPSLLERLDPPGTPDVPLYAMAAMAAAGSAPDRMTDSIVANLVSQQTRAGNWTGPAVRPPLEEGDVSRTALGVRMMVAFASPARAPEMKDRISRASAWLLAANPVSSEDRNMRLLGLYWSGRKAPELAPMAKTILGSQRADGGWAQIEGLESDAYGTGQSLFALVESGTLSPRDEAYRKGVKFLLSTQREDGSWFVRSRSAKFQPYFESGFPYAGDQWISSMATGWAAAAIAHGLELPAKKSAE